MPVSHTSCRSLLGAALLGAFLVSGPVPAAAQQDRPERAQSSERGQRDYGRSVHAYRTPQVAMVDANGAPVDFAAAIAEQPATIISFIFTTCAGVCPVITANMARAVPELDKLGRDYRILLVSLDPEFDTPERLREYGKRFKTGERIDFLTGDSASVHEILRAFNAVYLGGKKMNHQPVTLLRANPEDPWVRLDGLVNGRDVARELAAVIAEHAPTALSAAH